MEKQVFPFFKPLTDYQSEYGKTSIFLWKSIALLGFVLLPLIGQARQSTILEEYIQLGLDSNLQLQRASLNIDESLEALNQAKALFKPRVSFEASYTLAQGGRMINLPIGDLLNPVYSTLNQMTGTEQFAQLDNVEEQFLPNNFHETKFRVIQPLFNSDIYYGYKAKQELISVQQAQRKVYAQELVKEIKTAYFQILKAHRAIAIYEDTQKLLSEVLRVNQKLVANGKATNEVIYGTEYERSRMAQALQEAQSQYQVAQAYFNFLLNKDLDSPVKIDELLAQEVTSAPSLQEAEGQAGSQRAEFSQLQAAMNAQAQLTEMQKSRALPSLNLVGDLGYQGFGYTFNNQQDFWLLQLSLKWNIFQGGKRRSELQQSQIAEQKLQTQQQQLQQQVQLQVKQAFYQYQTTLQGIQTAESGLRNAQRQYEITQRKHQEGQVPSFQLLDAQTKYTNARLSLSIAQCDRLIKLAELERAMGL